MFRRVLHNPVKVMIRFSWVFALALASLWAGCLEEPRQSPNGLGLDTTTPIAPAAPVEPVAELDHLFSFAASLAPLVGRCPSETNEENVHARIANQSTAAFRLIREACNDGLRDTMHGLAARAIENGTEHENFTKLHGQATDAMDKLLGLIQNMPSPGSFADAEFQASFQIQYSTHGDYMEGARRQYQSYQAHRGQPFNEGNLRNSFTTIAQTIEETAILSLELESYEWMPGVCQVPSHESQTARVWRFYEVAEQRALEKATPQDLRNISNRFGLLVNDIKPSIEEYVKENFTMALVDVEADLQYNIAYAENYTNEVMPTWEEAIWLADLHQSRLNSISTNGFWQSERNVIQSYKPSFTGEEFPRHIAVRGIALQAITWPFGGFDCRPLDGSTP